MSSETAPDSSAPTTAPGMANAEEVATTAVSLWFSKTALGKNASDRRYKTVAAWSYNETTKELRYSIFKDQGPAPYLHTLTSWIAQLQPQTVYVSCGGSGKGSALEQDKNLCLWMSDIEEDLQNQSLYSDDDQPDHPENSPGKMSRVVPSIVPPEVNKDGVEVLRSLVQNNTAELYQLQANKDLTSNNEKNAATPLLNSAAVLLQGVGLYQPTLGPSSHAMEGDDASNGFTVRPEKAKNFMVLDRAACTSLNVWPITHAGQAEMEGATSWHTSLFGLLSHFSRTQMGKQQLRQWLLHPLIELEPLLERQEVVSYLVDNAIARQSLGEEGLQPMAGTKLEKLANQLAAFANVEVPDEDGTDAGDSGNRRILGSTRSALQKFFAVYLLAEQKVPALADQLRSILDENQSDDSPSLELVKKCAAEVFFVEGELRQNAVGLVENLIDLELAPREFVVKSSFSEHIEELMQELAQWQSELEDCHTEMDELWKECSGLSSSNSTNKHVRLHIPEAKNDGEASYEFYFRLPNPNDSQLLQKDKSLKQHKIHVHKVQKTGVYFNTPALRQLASKRADLDSELDKYQSRIVAQAAEVACSWAPLLHRLRHAVAVLDGLCSMAQLAAFNDYCKPTLTDSNDDGHGIELKGARHPCVECQDTVDFIPNDVALTLGKKSCWLVTGPNMGGKSTFIRSVGAIAVLAQMGGFVPCSEAKINLVHSISARVGAGDLQDRGISTFMSEMLEASAILQTATRRSLIIVDELGRGTSTFDGYGLARAICEFIVEKTKCLTVFATHFHELTSTLPAQFPNGEVHNCHVSAQTADKEVVFLYKVEEGPCQESYGIPVAEMAQVPPQVIIDAKANLLKLQSSSSSDVYKKRPREGEDADDYNSSWEAKFRRINIPELLKKGDDSGNAIKQAMEHVATQ